MLVRPLRAGDTERVQQFVRRLSARSRLERFFAPLARSSRSPSTPAGDSGHAEIALVVADAWQGRGLGGRLLAVLLEHARQAGLSRLEGVTRTGNDAMRGLATKLGFGLRRDADPRLVRLERAVGA
jgi:GNAT superfamily N-acetyltransferase